MPRDWMREEQDLRRGRWDDRRDTPRREDYGQADYSTDYAYDRDRGEAYRQFSDDEEAYDRGSGAWPGERDRGSGEQSRSWLGRPLVGGRDEAETPRRRRGPSDRVLWAVIVERLEDVRGLDLRDVEVLVDNAEVTLNGTVRRKEDKRRIEDIADLDGVRHVQNNLRVREGGLRRWF